MSDAPLLVGFAGSAKADPALVKAELDDYLPEDIEVEGVLVPAKILRLQAGLKNVVSWLEEAFGEQGFDTTDNLVADLKDYGNSVLILAYDEDNGKDFDLFKAASEAGVLCKDLCQGLDDMDFEPEGAKDPEPEQPTRGSRRRTARSSAPADAEPEETSRSRRTARTAAPKDKTEPTGSTGKASEADHQCEGLFDESFPRTLQELYAAIDGRVALHLHNMAKSMGEQKSPGRPRRDGSPAQAHDPEKDEFTFILEDGEYKKKGRGRPRRGQEEVTMTRAEAREKDLLHLIEEEN